LDRARRVARAAILTAAHQDGAIAGSPLLVEEADNLADAVVAALYPAGHEDTPEHWRANAAEEKRRKQHVSGLLSEAVRERDALRRQVAALTAERQELGSVYETWRGVIGILCRRIARALEARR